MKHIKEYNNYDFLGMQAALHGMTREEWTAVYGTSIAGVDESKYVMTYEKYITYDKLGKWGKYSNESEVEDDLRMTVIRLFQYGGISNKLDDVIYTDQSSDKGIKWQIEVKGKGSDLIHAYKDGKFKGQYEWYLNKKRSSKADIQEYFADKYLDSLEIYMQNMKAYDFNYERSEDPRAYRKGDEQKKELISLYSNLSTSDKKEAYKQFSKTFDIKTPFKSFTGA